MAEGFDVQLDELVRAANMCLPLLVDGDGSEPGLSQMLSSVQNVEAGTLFASDTFSSVQTACENLRSALETKVNDLASSLDDASVALREIRDRYRLADESFA